MHHSTTKFKVRFNYWHIANYILSDSVSLSIKVIWHVGLNSAEFSHYNTCIITLFNTSLFFKKKKQKEVIWHIGLDGLFKAPELLVDSSTGSWESLSLVQYVSFSG